MLYIDCIMDFFFIYTKNFIWWTFHLYIYRALHYWSWYIQATAMPFVEWALHTDDQYLSWYGKLLALELLGILVILIWYWDNSLKICCIATEVILLHINFCKFIMPLVIFVLIFHCMLIYSLPYCQLVFNCRDTFILGNGRTEMLYNILNSEQSTYI